MAGAVCFIFARLASVVRKDDVLRIGGDGSGRFGKFATGGTGQKGAAFRVRRSVYDDDIVDRFVLVEQVVCPGSAEDFVELFSHLFSPP